MGKVSISRSDAPCKAAGGQSVHSRPEPLFHGEQSRGVQGWGVHSLFGRLAEVSSGPRTSALTLALRLVVEAQKLDEPVAWVTGRASCFFPPDARATGIDLDALAVIWTPAAPRCPRRARYPGRHDPGGHSSGRNDLTAYAADLLVRSGGFGLVVLDLGRNIDLPMAMQTRLAGLARKHQTAILCLTEKASDERSLGALVSLRVEATRTEKIGDRFRCGVRMLKDKQPNGTSGGASSGNFEERGGGAVWRPGDLVWEEACRAPDGLC